DHQRALALQLRHREVAEDHQEHEDVVDRQRLLDQVAGQELHADAPAGLRAEALPRVPPQPGVEGQRQRHPAHAPPGGFPEADLVRAAVAHQHQVGQQRERHHGAEHQPEEGSTDRVHAMRSVRATEASMQGTWKGSALRRSAKVSLTGRLACHGAGAWWARHDDDRARSYSPSSATIPDSAVPDVNANMNEPLPVVRLKNAWNSTHPWIFQRLVE